MDERKWWIFILILVSIIVLFIITIALVWKQPKKHKVTEGFDTVDDIYNTVTSDEPPSNIFNDVDLGNNNDAPLDIHFRQCALYYTSNVALCDDRVNNWYIRSLEDLRAYRDQLTAKASRTAVENQRLQDVTKVITERESGTLPQGACKVRFPGWVEPSMTPSGEPYPLKNKADANITNRGSPKDWAYCYKSAANETEAITQSRLFADNYGVTSFDEAGDYFGNGQIYGKIAFAALNLSSNATPRPTNPTGILDFVCANQPPRVSNVPSSMLIFEMTNAYLLNDMYLGWYDEDKLSFSRIMSPQLNSSVLFDTRLQNGGLYLVPKTLTGTIYRFGFDVCGRLSDNNMTGTSFSMSLMRDLNMRPRLLFTAPSTTSPQYGTVEDLRNRVFTLASVAYNANANIAALNSHITTNPQYAMGHVRYTYSLNMTTQPDMNSATALNNIFNRSDVVMQTREIVTAAPSVRTNSPRTKYAYILEGFINIGNGTAGTYTFKVSSDDAGDLFLGPASASAVTTAVATHYGNHPMNDTGVKMTYTLQRNTYYRFRARMVQWMGGSGIALQWKVGNAAYADIPASVIYYDQNDTRRYQLSQSQRERDQAISDKTLVNQAISTIETAKNQAMTLAFQDIRNKSLELWKRYRSMDGKLYVNIGLNLSALSSVHDPVVIQEAKKNIATTNSTAPSPVNRFDGMVQYSISFWIFISKTYASPVNIFQHGININDSTPNITIQSNSTIIRIGQKSSDLSSDGCELNNGVGLNTWKHIVAVVNGTNANVSTQPAQSIQLYVDGQKLAQGTNSTNFKQLTNKNVWHWGTKMGKNVRVGYNNFSNPGNGVFVQKVYWYNHVLSPTEVSNIYNTTRSTLQT